MLSDERLTRNPGYVNSFEVAIDCLRREAEDCDKNNRVGRASMLRSIAGELQALRSAATAVVKPLEWGKTSYGTPEVSTIAGTYRLNNAWNGGWSVSRNNTVLAASNGLTNFATEAEAKAAAQADFNARILSCLSSPAPEPIAEPVNEALGRIITAWDSNSGHEPSVSVLHRAIDLGRDLLASLDPEALNPEQFNAWSELSATLATPPEPKPEAVSDMVLGFEWTDAMYAAFNPIQAQKSHPSPDQLLAIWKALHEAALTKESGK